MTQAEFEKLFSSLPIEDQIKLTTDFTKHIESDSTISVTTYDEFIEELQKYKNTYSVDEKEDFLKNDYNHKDLTNKFKKDTYDKIKLNTFAPAESTGISLEEKESIDLADKIQQGVGALEKGIRNIPVGLANTVEAGVIGYVT